jgi:hypothetical protein
MPMLAIIFPAWQMATTWYIFSRKGTAEIGSRPFLSRWKADGNQL